MNVSRKWIVFSLASGGLVFTGMPAVFAEPTTQPAATQPTTQPTAASVLDDINSAYARLTAAQFDGTITGRFDVRGEVHQHQALFSSSFAAPNKFRHETKDDSLVGSTGTNGYSYLAQHDQYQTSNAPKDRTGSGDWPANIVRILSKQNPALLLALSNSATVELREFSIHPTLERPTVLDGVAYPTLRFDVKSDREIITMLFDPVTHLLRRASFDYRKTMEKAGTLGVKQAEVTIDYTKAVGEAPVDANPFAWTPPTGAAMVTPAMAVDAPDGVPFAATELVGKAAPDFTLNKLDGTPVTLSSLKGSVVVVDLWGTYCPPCIAALPVLDKLYADESSHGLKMLAVNVGEDKQFVQAYVDKKKWTLPVVIDTDGKVEEMYKAESLPETVVVGKDGVVKQVFIGINQEEGIKARVATEMK